MERPVNILINYKVTVNIFMTPAAYVTIKAFLP